MTTKTIPTYLALCTEYYDLDKPLAPKEALHFYMHYVQRAKGPILEPMCGTGRFLIPMLEAGFEIDGFDASSHMLNALKAKCIKKNITANVWQGLLQDIDIKKQYALIFIPSGSFGLIINTEQIKLSLQKIFQQLRPGGIFIFEIERESSTSEQFGLWHGSMQMRQDSKMIVASFLPLAPVDSIRTIIGRYDLVDKSILLKTEFEYYQIKHYTKDEMKLLLQEAGFKSVKTLKPYNLHERPSKDDESIIFECTK